MSCKTNRKSNPVIRWIYLTPMILAPNFTHSQGASRTIPLYKGTAPGSETWDWEEKETTNGKVKLTYNVVSPTLTIFKPKPENASGKAVIICPGGAFYVLAMEHEGYDVARWLQEKGITAFVLKYRTMHCLTDTPQQELMLNQPNSEQFNKDIEPLVAMGINDGMAAIAYVRKHASEWDIRQDKIGIMGFSAGGTISAGTAFKYDADSRPDFVAPIYPYIGSFGHPQVPKDAPPLFVAGATDDTFGFQSHCTKLYIQWLEAKKSAELHIYRKGGHGFGISSDFRPANTWINRFYEWLNNL